MLKKWDAGRTGRLAWAGLAALLLMRDGTVWIKDLGSLNGTLVDGQIAVQPAQVCDPLAAGIQVELASPFPGWQGILRAARELMFLDPRRPANAGRLRDAAQRFNAGIGAIADPTFPFILFAALATLIRTARQFDGLLRLEGVTVDEVSGIASLDLAA